MRVQLAPLKIKELSQWHLEFVGFYKLKIVFRFYQEASCLLFLLASKLNLDSDQRTQEDWSLSVRFSWEKYCDPFEVGDTMIHLFCIVDILSKMRFIEHELWSSTLNKNGLPKDCASNSILNNVM